MPTNDRKRAEKIIADILHGVYLNDAEQKDAISRTVNEGCADYILAALESAGLPIGGPGVTLTSEEREKFADDIIGHFELTCIGHLGGRYADPNRVRGVWVGRLRQLIEDALLRIVATGEGDGPVDEAWLRSVGFKQMEEDGEWIITIWRETSHSMDGPDDYGTCLIYWTSGECEIVDMNAIGKRRHNGEFNIGTTRRELLALLAALKIPLPPPPAVIPPTGGG